jgi:hypothetical protein
MKKTTRKLSLKTETVRRLTKENLQLVVGGKPNDETKKGPCNPPGGHGAPNDPPGPPDEWPTC